MIDNVKRRIVMVYNAILNGKIAFEGEMREIGHLEFLEIKKDCLRYECVRDKHKKIRVHATNFKYPNNYGTIIALTLNSFEEFLNTSFFKNYSSFRKHVARSILQYSSDDFIERLICYSISYSDIESFLNMINHIKNNVNSSLNRVDNASNLASLDENYDLINLFFNFAVNCKEFFGYGNLNTVINKLEQLYMFENKELRRELEKHERSLKKMKH